MRRNRWFWVALISILPLSGTMGHAEDHLAQLDLPATEWVATEMLEVERRNGFLGRQRLTFGKFATSEMRRSGTQRHGHRISVRVGLVPVYWKEYERRKQSLRFVLDDGEGNLAEVFGLTEFRADHFDPDHENSAADILLDLMGAGPPSDHSFLVSIYLEEEQRPWEMIFDNRAVQADRQHFSAFLARGPGEVYRIVPVYRLRSRRGVASLPSRLGPIGFEFRDLTNDRPVAAFSFLDDGQIYFNEGASDDERLLLSAAAAALLLQEEIG